MTNVQKLSGLFFCAAFLLAAHVASAQPFDTKFTEEVATEKAVMAFVQNKTEPTEPQQKEPAEALAAQTATGGYKLMSVAELKDALDAKTPMLLVDTMPGDSFAKGHFPGAVNFLFPVQEMGVWDAKETGGKTVDDFANLLGPDKNRKIVFYCGFVKCTRSHNAAMWAVKLGYTDVTRVPGGLFAWMGAGYPLEAAK
jgi:rhodanese-related sulfurtransferase